MDFRLHEPPLLSRRPLDRPLALREDPAALDAGWAGAKVLRLSGRGKVRGDRDGLHYVTGAEVSATRPDSAVLLGRQGDRHVWAVHDDSVAADPVPGEIDAAPQVADLRVLGSLLDEQQTGELVTAQALLNWHSQAGYCARDGQPTTPSSAGWSRICTRCGAEEFPRTDAAIICLVHDGADRVLLARQPAWPVGRYSVLAGFVESGESLEACVHREIAEEVGLDVTDIGYLGSQAWPFPRSLMVGFRAIGDPDAPLRLADGEIADALWVTRTQLRAALVRGDWGTREDRATQDDTDPVVMLPGRVSIARTMLDAWAAAGD